MHVTNGDGHVIDAGTGEAIYADENPPVRDATQLRHEEANSFQEEICNVIRGVDTLNNPGEAIADMTQLRDAIITRITNAIALLRSSVILDDSNVTGASIADALNNLLTSINTNTGNSSKLALQLEKLVENNTYLTYDINDPEKVSQAVSTMYPEHHKKGLRLSYAHSGSLGQQYPNIITMGVGQARLNVGNLVKAPGVRLTTQNFGQLFINDTQISKVNWVKGVDGTVRGKFVSTATLPTVGSSNFWVYVFMLYNPNTDEVDWCVDTSPTGANIAANPDLISAGFAAYAVRTGCVYIENTTHYHIYHFTQVTDNKFLFNTPVLSYSSVPTATQPSTNSVTLDLPECDLGTTRVALINTKVKFTSAVTQYFALYNGRMAGSNIPDNYSYQVSNVDALLYREEQFEVELGANTANQISITKGFAEVNISLDVHTKGWYDFSQ